MSWFARSIANTLKLHDDDDDDDDEQYPVNKNTDDSTNQKHEQQVVDNNLPQSPGRGVKEDLSEITKTLTRQFWGVASFLAPPLPSDGSEPSDPGASAPEAISGIRRDFAEIGGKFRSGISKLSNNIDVSEITKMASNFLQLESEDEDSDSTDGDGDGAVGITDEVVAFARDIALHPETWLDFPLPDDEDFHLSDAQQEHALAVEHLAPRLSAVRIQLCPGYMTETYFWMIYFVLLHPILEYNAAKLLSTPKIVRARSLLTHELKNRQLKNEARRSSSCSETIAVSEPESGLLETVKQPIESDEIKIVDKSVIQEDPSDLTKDKDEDEWLKEEIVTVPVGNHEDVSFSDLEDDDGNIPIHYKKVTHGSDSSRRESGGWVELGRSSMDSGGGSGHVSVHNSETKESNDWLDVVDIDVA